jgi:putative transposase
MKAQPLTPGMFYHIYNRGINGCEIFREKNDYERFLRLYDTYIDPVAETYAWALMGNHFHLVIQIKDNICYRFSNADRSIDAVRFQEMKWLTHDLSACEAPDSVKKINPKNHFSHLFNSYSKYYNTKYNRHGSLFERPFKRIKITSETYLRHVIMYVQNNPVLHGFCEHTIEYPWTSYLSTISKNSTKLKREEVLDLFGGKENFKYSHSICTNVFDVTLELY